MLLVEESKRLKPVNHKGAQSKDYQALTFECIREILPGLLIVRRAHYAGGYSSSSPTGFGDLGI